MSAFREFVRSLETGINSPGIDIESWLKPYNDLVMRHMLRNESDSARGVEVNVGRDSVRARRVDYTFNKDSLVALLWDLYSVAERDETLRSVLDMAENISDENHVHGLRAMRNSLRELENNLDEFSLTLSFYVSGSRLVQITAEIYDKYSLVQTQGGMTHPRNSQGDGLITLNFGTNADSTWTISLTEPLYPEYLMTIEWRYSGTETSRIRHELVIDGETHLDLGWSPANGEFALFLDNGWEVTELTGSYFKRDNGFELSFEFRGADIRIRAESGVVLPLPSRESFVDIDRWNDTLTGELSEMDLGGILGMFGMLGSIAAMG
jgi:hypothetical protein